MDENSSDVFLSLYKAMVSSPEADLCREAGKRLFRELGKKLDRESLKLVGLTLNSSGDGPAIRIVVRGVDPSEIPSTFEGYEVLIVVVCDATA